MGSRVLVVDDEPQIREILRGYLTQAGFTVEEAADGATALDAIRAAEPDVVLLDLGLPDIDGVELLRRLRTFSEVYVIVITARAEEIDTIIGLSVGADDYVTKPFSPREIVARVSAILRRQRPTGHEPGPAGNQALVVDPARREVAVNGRPVELSALEFDLLAALHAEPGRVFSRPQLLRTVWGYDFFGDERVVDVHIRNLRRLLGDDAADPHIIGTVRGVGYKLIENRP